VIAVVALIVAAWPVHQLGVAFGFWQPFTRPPAVFPWAHYLPAFELD